MGSKVGNEGGRRWGLAGLFLVAGIPTLVGQVVWIRVFMAGLGHEWLSLTGVVSAYFLGWMAGAWVWERRVRSSKRPLRGYAFLEWAAAGWTLATTGLLDGANRMALVRWGGVGVENEGGMAGIWVAWMIPLAVVGPVAMALGGTWPAMEQAVVRHTGAPRVVAGLYALNTAGAVVGLVLAVSIAMPVLGFRGTLVCAAVIQVVCGGIAFWGDQRGWGRGGIPRSAGVGGVSRGRAGTGGLRGWAWALGGLGLGYQLLGVRLLSQVMENTVESYAMALGLYLVGTVLGAAAAREWVRRGRTLDRSLLGLALAGCGAWLLGLRLAAPSFYGFLDGWLGARWAEGVMAGGVFLVPAAVMAMVFSQVVQEAADRRLGVGWAVGWNALGAAMAGPFWMGWWVPALGWTVAVTGVLGGYWAVAKGWRRWPGWGVAALAMGLAAANLAQERVGRRGPAGGVLVERREGRLATVEVEQMPDGQRTLRVNRRWQQGGTGTATASRRQGHLPLLLHPSPRRALFLGVGTGLGLGAAMAHPGLRVDAVELLPEVVAVVPRFAPENGWPYPEDRVRWWTTDARRYVRGTQERYDVVVADLYHPGEDGAGLLYTREHFEGMRGCLATGGLVCQWLPLHQMDLAVLRDVVATFRVVFPEARAWWLRVNLDVPVVGLVWRDGGWPEDPAFWVVRGDDPGLVEALRVDGLVGFLRVWGSEVAGAGSLAAWGDGGKVATDDLPRVMFQAGRMAYRPAEDPAGRMVTLLEGWVPETATAWSERGWPNGASKLEAYWEARWNHVQGLIHERARRWDEAVEAYLASAAASPDYTGGYADAVLLASARGREDPSWARAVLRRLVEVRPEERLAAELLRRWEVVSP
jgi:spermidine synthase